METFVVLQPGPMTTIQDLGRFGYQQFGVPQSGAMDNYAYRIGNLIVGSEQGAPSLEITLFGLRLRLLRDTMVAITGADLAPALNGNPIPMWEALPVKRGDIISFPRLKSGCRAYLAAVGGFDVPRVMTSASTYIRAGLGGFAGRALRTGDVLHTIERQVQPSQKKVPSEYIPAYGNQIELRVILGPQDDHFTQEGIATFLKSTYTISAQADRMGYRLDGSKIQHRSKADIISDGIPLGAVQVPGYGLPIVLLVDRQTTGGYAKLATVISTDIPKLAQTKPGDRVKFCQITEDEAYTALQDYEQRIETLTHMFGKPRP